MAKQVKFLIPILFTFSLIILFYFKRIIAIKFYPPLMNSFIFMVFFASLFKEETIIQKFAKLMDGELNDKIRLYTRNLTYIWCIFLFLNLCFSIITIFMSDKIWLIYNGFLSYILIGLMFVIEYPIRMNYRRRNNL